MPLLIEAIRQRRYKKIQLALQLGWNLNQRDPDELRTPLIELTFLEKEDIAARLCKRFLFAGARVDLKDRRRRNALHWACLKSREKLVEIVLNEMNEFDMNAQDYEGNTALSLAVISDNENIVRKLLKALTRYRLSVDVPNNNGETPLILASKARSYVLCEMLTKIGGASTEIRDKIKQLNAKEWESTAENIRQDIDFAQNTTYKSEIEKLWRLSKRPRSVRNDYKSEIYKLFSVYYDELSSSFRPPAIPPVKEEGSEFSDLPTCSENENDYSGFLLMGSLSTCAVTSPRGKRRFTKAAQIPVSVTRMRKVKNTGTEKSQSALVGRYEFAGKVSGKRSIIPILEVNTIVPVVKRSSCPVLRQRRTINDKDEMATFRLEVLNEDVEQANA